MIVLLDTIYYTYDDAQWGDLLTAYDGATITYDDIGNPLSDGTWTYTWKYGRQLASMTSGTTTWNYTYDANGMRTGRTPSNGIAYTYVYNGSQLSRMAYGSNTLIFAYDASGNPMTVTYAGSTFYYVTNLQGDVIAILNSAGTSVVQYTYDAWGKVLTTTGTMAPTLGLINPLRYRGYVYDRETGVYYLQSRYYNPTMGRFLNADALVATGQGVLGNNMFAYCGNNPTNNVDVTGYYYCKVSFDAFSPFDTALVNVTGTSGGGSGLLAANVVAAAVKSDPVYQYITNTNEQVVINAKYVAFYNGQLVIKLPMGENAAFYGIMFIGNEVTSHNTIRHEYGHSRQWKKKGASAYTFEVAIPSVTINLLSRMEKLPYDYYTYPWEAEADMLGGVTTRPPSQHPPLPKDSYSWYWDILKLFWE